MSGSRRSNPRRRAAALAAAVMVIATLNLVIIGSLSSGTDDAMLASQRLDSTRALLAAESGVALVIGELSGDRPIPEGEVVLPSGQIVTIESVSVTPPMQVDITGRSGLAQRIIRIRVE